MDLKKIIGMRNLNKLFELLIKELLHKMDKKLAWELGLSDSLTSVSLPSGCSR
jgi:hypothetical protein